jgi:DNA-directed RNA polymerase specialized sigma24 family protein
VAPVSRPKEELDRGLGAEGFASFLAWLDPDPERAARMYTDIQKRLTRMFDYRGCDQPEELADETITRVMRQSADLAESYEGDPVRYFYGVARNVVRQHYTARSRAQARVLLATPAPPPPEDLERRHACLDRCLESALTPDERHLILEYYRSEKRGGHIAHRGGLAQDAEVSSSTLRKRTERIRRRLGECLLACLETEAGPDGER